MKTTGLRISGKFERPVTLSESIYAYLKKAIIEGEMKPGQRLYEKEIAPLFNASTTPVREAFQKLSAEKFLKINSRKDVTVVPVSLEEIEELFDIVRLLDSHATKLAIDRLTPEEIGELKKMTARIEGFYRQKSVFDYVSENMKIHEKLWTSCGNRYLSRTLVEMAEKYVFLSNHLFSFDSRQAAQAGFFARSLQDHLGLMEAIEKRDKASAEKILLSHWGKGFLGEDAPPQEKKGRKGVRDGLSPVLTKGN